MKDLQFVGIGGATCIELGGNCCFLKEGDKLLIVDACECACERLVRAKALEGVREISIVISHTHYDHVAGLGTLIWYTNFNLNISPKIIVPNGNYRAAIKDLLDITGVSDKYYSFVSDTKFNLNGLKLKYKLTKHTPNLTCYGVMFEDGFGKYYYTGDTREIGLVKKYAQNEDVKKIYCEVSEQSFGVHILYEDLLQIKSDKIVPMHFGTIALYKRAKRDGFNMPKWLK